MAGSFGSRSPKAGHNDDMIKPVGRIFEISDLNPILQRMQKVPLTAEKQPKASSLNSLIKEIKVGLLN